MKAFILVSLLVSSYSFGAVINSAKLDDSQENILVEVSYGGGCKEHNFELQITACAETFPVQCTADLVETVVDGPDFCEAFITKIVELNLRDNNLDDIYFSGGSLTIKGDKKANGRASRATIVLPRINGLTGAIMKKKLGEPDPF